MFAADLAFVRPARTLPKTKHIQRAPRVACGGRVMEMKEWAEIERRRTEGRGERGRGGWCCREVTLDLESWICDVV